MSPPSAEFHEMMYNAIPENMPVPTISRSQQSSSDVSFKVSSESTGNPVPWNPGSVTSGNANVTWPAGYYYECNQCQYRFASEADYRQHANEHALRAEVERQWEEQRWGVRQVRQRDWSPWSPPDRWIDQAQEAREQERAARVAQYQRFLEQELDFQDRLQRLMEQQMAVPQLCFHIWNIRELRCEQCGITREQFLNRERAEKDPVTGKPVSTSPVKPLPFRRIELPEPSPTQDNQ